MTNDDWIEIAKDGLPVSDAPVLVWAVIDGEGDFFIGKGAAVAKTGEPTIELAYEGVEGAVFTHWTPLTPPKP